MNLIFSSAVKSLTTLFCIFLSTLLVFVLTRTLRDDIPKTNVVLLIQKDTDHPFASLNQTVLSSDSSSISIQIHKYKDANSLMKFFSRQTKSESDGNLYILDSLKTTMQTFCSHLKQMDLSWASILALSQIPPSCDLFIRPFLGPPEAHLVALSEYLDELRATEVIVFTDKLMTNVSVHKVLIDNKRVVPIYIDRENSTENNTIAILSRYPNAPLLFNSGQILKETFSDLKSNGSHFYGHMILAHLGIMERYELLGTKNDNFHTLRNQLIITTTLRPHTPTDPILHKAINNVEISSFLQTLNSLIINNRKPISNSTIPTCELDLIGYVSHNHMKQYYKWYLVNSISLEQSISFPYRWRVKELKRSVYKIWTKEDILELSEHNYCSPSVVSIADADPFYGQTDTRNWTLESFPTILFPVSQTRGHSITLWCSEGKALVPLEITCLATSEDRFTSECLTVKTNSNRRRVVRSYRTNHIIRTSRNFNNNNLRQANDNTVRDRRQRFRDILPQIGGCIGATGGCSLCFAYLLYTSVPINPGVCYGACSVGVGGSCTSLMSIGIQTTYDNTVICTELFQQGRIDFPSYIADAKFGAKLSKTNVLSMDGYRKAASPLVSMMKKSSLLSDIVNSLAKPWIRHMEFEENLRSEDDIIGNWMTYFGLIICYLLGICLIYPTTIVCLVLVVIVMSQLCRTILCHRKRKRR